VTTTDPLFLNQAEVAAVDARIAAIEAAAGVEVVAAVIGKADAYPELPWTAFAVGASLAAFATVVADRLRPDWAMVPATLVAAVTILGVGAVCALAAVFIPAFARLFLRAPRCEVEVREHARSLFLERELFRTRERTGILILVSLFERRIELLPDTGFAAAVARARLGSGGARNDSVPVLPASGRGLAGRLLRYQRAPRPPRLCGGPVRQQRASRPTHRIERRTTGALRWLLLAPLLLAGAWHAPVRAADVPYPKGASSTMPRYFHRRRGTS